MSGAVNVEAVVGRVRREVHPPVDKTDFLADVQLIKPLDDFSCRRRACKALIIFSDLPPSCRTNSYDIAAGYFIDNQVRRIHYAFCCRRECRATVWSSNRQLRSPDIASVCHKPRVGQGEDAELSWGK